jgi:hypothetical protein
LLAVFWQQWWRRVRQSYVASALVHRRRSSAFGPIRLDYRQVALVFSVEMGLCESITLQPHTQFACSLPWFGGEIGFICGRELLDCGTPMIAPLCSIAFVCASPPDATFSLIRWRPLVSEFWHTDPASELTGTCWFWLV